MTLTSGEKGSSKGLAVSGGDYRRRMVRRVCLLGYRFRVPHTDKVIGTVLTWATFYLIYVLPGVDRKAVMAWLLNLVPGIPPAGIVLVFAVAFSVLPATAIGF